MERKPFVNKFNPFKKGVSKRANKINFYINMRIVHVDFGTGTVIGLEDQNIRVRFDGGERGYKRIPKNSKKIMTVESAFKKMSLRKANI